LRIPWLPKHGSDLISIYRCCDLTSLIFVLRAGFERARSDWTLRINNNSRCLSFKRGSTLWNLWWFRIHLFWRWKWLRKPNIIHLAWHHHNFLLIHMSIALCILLWHFDLFLIWNISCNLSLYWIIKT
jgi:hypothetical protein